MNDLISRQAAIDALHMHLMYRMGTDSNKKRLDEWINNLPSAQPEPCKDAVSREAVSEWLKQYGQDVLHGKYKFSLMYIWKNLMDLPPAQPEQRWIPCSERLPEEGQKCLVCDKGSIGIDAYIGHGNPYNWKWYTRDYEAWMPLPKLYKEGDTT